MRSRDLVQKRRAYDKEGVASYWIVEPKLPSLTALELQDGAYVEVARVAGEQAWTATQPFTVTVVPAALRR